MRDPARIERMLGKLRAIWWTNPDARLCQIIGNVAPDGDNYFLEDDVLEAMLDGYPGLSKTANDA